MTKPRVVPILAFVSALFASSAVHASLNGTVAWISPDDNSTYTLNGPNIRFHARIYFSVTTGDTNIYDIRYAFYAIDPDGLVFSHGQGPFEYPNAQGFNFVEVNQAQPPNKVGLWQFWAEAQYRIKGSGAAFQALVSDHR